MEYKKGFTLIELLVVVAIIGILAAVGVVAYSGYTSSAKKKTLIMKYREIVKFTQLGITKCQIDEEFKLKQSTSLTTYVWKPDQCPKIISPTNQGLDELTNYLAGHFQAERYYNVYKPTHPNYGTSRCQSSSANDGEICFFHYISPPSIEVSVRVDSSKLLVTNIPLN